MKKNFFKKLSFVMALAMMISVIAPAAGAFGATAPKLSSAKKYLFLGTEDANEYDFNISNKKTGWKYSWTSANADVATVNKKNGLTTAVGVGTTKVTVAITNAKGADIDELSATVIVKDNIATLKITNTPADNKLAVGKENDFNRSYVTVSGSTTKTTGVTRWSVDKEGATISDAGLFVATKAGTYKITANAFQSKAKYASWLVDKTKYASYVTATTEYTVTVPNTVKAVSATKSNAIKVEFASAVTAVDKANFVVANASTTNKLFIKSVVLSDDKTYATINLYDSMVTATAYKITAKVDDTDMTAELNYVKGVPTKITAATTQVAPAGQKYTISYAVLDQNGVDITADTTVSFDSSYGTVDSTGVITLASGVLEYVYVVYTNPTTAEQIKSERIAVSGVAGTGSDVTAINLWKTGATPNFASGRILTTLFMDGSNGNTSNGEKLVVRFKYKDQYGVETVAPQPTSSNDGITFESLDPNIFVVDAYTGTVTPVSVGTGYFRIKMGNINVIKSLTVRANPYVNGVAVDGATSYSVSDTGNLGKTNADVTTKKNTAKVTVHFLNQYSERQYSTSPLKFKILTGSGLLTYAGSPFPLVTGGSGYDMSSNTETIFAAASNISTSGNVVLKIYNPNNEAQFCTVNIAVYAKNNVETGFVVDGVKDLDVEHFYDGLNWTKDFSTTLKVYSVNSQNFKVDEVTNASIAVTGPNSQTKIINPSASTGYLFDTTNNNVHGSADFMFRTGAYTVVAKVNGTVVATGSFSVKDTGVKPSPSYASNNDFVAVTGTLTVADLQAKLTGLDGFDVKLMTFTSSDTTKVLNYTDAASAAIGGTATLYNVKVKVEKSIADIYGGPTQTRAYWITIGNLDVSVN